MLYMVQHRDTERYMTYSEYEDLEVRSAFWQFLEYTTSVTFLTDIHQPATIPKRIEHSTNAPELVLKSLYAFLFCSNVRTNLELAIRTMFTAR